VHRPPAERCVLRTFSSHGRLGAVSPLQLSLDKHVRTTQCSCASRRHPLPVAASALPCKVCVCTALLCCAKRWQACAPRPSRPIIPHASTPIEGLSLMHFVRPATARLSAPISHRGSPVSGRCHSLRAARLTTSPPLYVGPGAPS
jgi:hypothetical protein